MFENNFYFIWSNHHIILDGWSTNIVFKEFFDLCNFNKKDLSLESVKSGLFSKYINWIYKLDESKAKDYWSKLTTVDL